MRAQHVLLLFAFSFTFAHFTTAQDSGNAPRSDGPFRNLRRGLEEDINEPDPLENEFERQNSVSPQSEDQEPRFEVRKRIRHGFRGSAEDGEFC